MIATTTSISTKVNPCLIFLVMLNPSIAYTLPLHRPTLKLFDNFFALPAQIALSPPFARRYTSGMENP